MGKSASMRRGLGSVLLVLAACAKPEPLGFTDFMEDRFAREGTLVRCDEDRQASVGDLECANARRAAVAIALREERARREELERESERKLAELRAEVERQRRVAAEAQAVAEAAARAAYDAQWRERLAKPPDEAGEPRPAEFDVAPDE